MKNGDGNLLIFGEIIWQGEENDDGEGGKYLGEG